MQKIILLLFSCLLITGCVSYAELDDLSIVSTLGIDYQNGKYQLYIQAIQGELEDQEVEKKITTYFGESESLKQAFANLYAKSSKRLYLSHMDLLILTEDAINQKLPEILHSFLENNEYRHNFHVVFLRTPLSEWMQDDLSSQEVTRLIQTNQKETSTVVDKEFETILQELFLDRNTYFPSISYQDQVLSLNGYVFIRNYQVVAQLDLMDSLLFNLLSNQISKAYLNQASISENQTIITTKKNQIHFQFFTTLDQEENWVSKTQKQLEEFLHHYYQKQDYDILKLTEKIRQNDYSYYQKQTNLIEKLTFTFSFTIQQTENYLKGDF